MTVLATRSTASIQNDNAQDSDAFKAVYDRSPQSFSSAAY